MQYLDTEHILSAKHCEFNIMPLTVNALDFEAIERGITNEVFIDLCDKRARQLCRMFLPFDKRRRIVVELQLLGDNGKLCKRMHFEMIHVMNYRCSDYSVQLGHRVVWED
jgi:hypothetical protein